jgi:hypothetical protein
MRVRENKLNKRYAQKLGYGEVTVAALPTTTKKSLPKKLEQWGCPKAMRLDLSLGSVEELKKSISIMADTIKKIEPVLYRNNVDSFLKILYTIDALNQCRRSLRSRVGAKK